MNKACNHCGAPHKEWVVRKKDGSNIWALDLDLSVEFPSTWAAPAPVIVFGNGLCQYCRSIRAKEKVG